jgi:flagellar basal-body rod modification protein FlgD
MAISALSNSQPTAGSLGAFGASAASAASPGSAKAARTDKAAPGESPNLGQPASAEDQSNRFLKLLVAQMSNQDPLNPMDSAQVTSQMAQISTVQGVQTLNKTVSGLDTQFTQLQTMQGAALVGHDVATEGNSVRVDPSTHHGDGGFEITNPATSVSVDVVNSAGQTIGTVKMGAQPAGRHSFDYDVPPGAQGQPLTFKVTAMNNTAELDSLPLAYNSISAVSTLNGKVAVELDNGKRVDYSAVWAFL